MNDEIDINDKISASESDKKAAEPSFNDYCTGVYPHSVDDKYRIKIPAEARSFIKGTFRLARAKDQAIAVYSGVQCERIFTSLMSRKKAVNSNAELTPQQKTLAIRSINRMFSSFTKEIEEDSQGRFVLPQSLMDWAGITKKCSVYTVGVGAHFEIWNAATYDGALNNDEYAEGLEVAGIYDLDME